VDWSNTLSVYTEYCSGKSNSTEYNCTEYYFAEVYRPSQCHRAECRSAQCCFTEGRGALPRSIHLNTYVGESGLLYDALLWVTKTDERATA